ncbi:MAG TPA: hypothetical protein VKB59_02485 [Micromonosporaceae bacterium]|nr:hypothetical protein [Micromonosporaceae bacterium]
MTNDSGFDASGLARQALRDVNAGHGAAGLDNVKLLDQLLPDLLPGQPREANLLRAAAGSGVAGLLRDRLGRMPTDAAVRDVAAVLAARSALDPTACVWVVGEYATVLGYPAPATLSPPVGGPINVGGGLAAAGTVADLAPGAGPFAAPAAPNPRPADPAGTPVAPAVTPPASWPPLPVDPWRTSAQPVSPNVSLPDAASPPVSPNVSPNVSPQNVSPSNESAPGGTAAMPTAPFGAPASPAGGLHPEPGQPPPGQYAPGQYPVGGYPPSGYQPSEYLPGQFPPGAGYPYPTPKRSKAPLIVGIVILVLIVAAGAGILALTNHPSHPNAGASHSPGATASTPSSGPSPATSTPAGSIPTLDTLMPTDLDVDLDCDVTTTGRDTGVTGVLTEYQCTEPSTSDLPGAFIDAYQFGSPDSLTKSLAAFNTARGFDPNASTNDDSCPPTSDHDGKLQWGVGDKHNRGTLECYISKSDTCVYIWTDTADRTLFYAGTTGHQTCADLQDWWRQDSGNAD